MFVVIIYIIASIYDLKERIIPNSLSVLLVIYGLLTTNNVCDSVVSFALMVMLIFFISVVCFFLYREQGKNALGGGDIKLLCSTSLALGFESTIMMLLVSLVVCLLVVIFSKGAIKTLPLAPFLLVGLIIIIVI